MTIGSIINIATSGLYASQSGLKTVSQNIANVNTKGYVRIEQEQTAFTVNGSVGGVIVSSLRRAANDFFQTASIAANAQASAEGIKADYLTQIQSVFGDPTGSSSLFARIDDTLGAFENAVINPGAISVRRDVLSQLSGVLNQLNQASSQVQEIRNDVDFAIVNKVDQVNALLQKLTKVNQEVMRGSIAGDANGALEEQSAIIDELSKFIDIRIDRKEGGIANVYTSDGTFLGGNNASTLNYVPSGLGQSTYNSITISFAGDSTEHIFDKSIQSGELRGLLDLRNKDIADIADNIGEFSGKFADALNAVHNVNSSLPAISNANGVDTGLMASDSLGFTGQTTIGIVASDGTLQRKIDIDFTAGTLSINGGAATPIATTIGGFAASINTALGGMGSANFVNGKLNLTSSVVGNGFVFDEPATNGSLRGDKAFAHFFGLNNLVTSSQPTSYTTGLKGSDAHGFTVGSTFSLRLNGANGQVLADRDFTIPAGDFNAILGELNNVSTGLGLYGNFAIDAKGSFVFNPNNSSQGSSILMTNDVGPRGTTNISLGQLTGLNQDKRFSRSSSLAINTQINNDPRKLGIAQADLSTIAIGSVAVGLGDSKGAQALFDITGDIFVFNSSLGMNGRTMTLSEFASSLAGDLGIRASSAETQKENATAMKTEAENRRSNVEGVNLDEELVKLTSYQQAYAASARLLKAADDMYETLLNAF